MQGHFRTRKRKREVSGRPYYGKRQRRDAAGGGVGGGSATSAILRNLLGIESKFHDVPIGVLPLATAGGFYPSLNLIPEGVTENTRVGRSCTANFLQAKIVFYGSSLIVHPSLHFTGRVIIGIDKQCNGSPFAVTQLLQTAEVLSYLKPTNEGRFEILDDTTFTMKLGAGAGDGDSTFTTNEWSLQSFMYERKIDLGALQLNFLSTTGQITEITSNNIFMCLIGSSTDISYEGKTRLTFEG